MKTKSGKKKTKRKKKAFETLFPIAADAYNIPTNI